MAKEFTIIENPDCVGKYRENGLNVVLSTIGRAWGEKDKGFQVCLPVPRDDEEAKEFYNLDLATLIEYGVQKVSTQVDFTVVIDDDKNYIEGMSDEDILARLQEAADNYQAGQRKPGKAKEDKATLSTLDAMAAEAGMTRVEFLAMLKAKHSA